MFSIRQRIVNPRLGPLLWIRPSIMCYRFSERFSRNLLRRGYGGQEERKGRKERKMAMKRVMMALGCVAMVALVVEDTESHAFLREGVDLF